MMKQRIPKRAARLDAEVPVHSGSRVLFDNARDFKEGWAELAETLGKALDSEGERMKKG